MSTVTLTEDALERILVAALANDRAELTHVFSMERLPSSVLRLIEMRNPGAFYGSEREVEPDDDAYDDGWSDGRADLIEDIDQDLDDLDHLDDLPEGLIDRIRGLIRTTYRNAA